MYKRQDRNVVSLINLINQLLDFRKMEEINYSPQLKPCDITALVQDICIRFRAAIETSGLQFETDLPDKPISYNVDRDAMTKIISNVLANAVKYASSQVHISLTEDDGSFRIVVEDDGPGVDNKMQSDIFKVFYRADNHKTGTGLGLPLARLLAEKHGGTLQLLASEGGGWCGIRNPDSAERGCRTGRGSAVGNDMPARRASRIRRRTSRRNEIPRRRRDRRAGRRR